MRQVETHRVSEESVVLSGVAFSRACHHSLDDSARSVKVIGIVPRVHSVSRRSVKSKTKDESRFDSESLTPNR